MADAETRFQKWRQNIGLVLAGACFLASIVWVATQPSASTVIAEGTQHITIGHWQLEDGYREGLQAVIDRYKEMKAREGIKVEITQSTIPYRAYGQWFRTQTVAGEPADIIEEPYNPLQNYRYFIPLSEYVAEPNPYNVGTRMEGVPWRDTFVDNMRAGFQKGEYMFANMAILMDRLFCNVDLIEKATGSRKLPVSLKDWLLTCQQIEEYGKRENLNVIPIAVRGFDRGTLKQLWRHYYAQLNQELVMERNMSGKGYLTLEDQFDGLLTDRYAGMESSIWAPAGILVELGQYFADGFTSIDLETAKSLFSQGKVAFMIEGSYQGLSLIQSSSFEVEPVPLPSVIESDSTWASYYDGRVNEGGSGPIIPFGITRKSKNLPLALDFLKFWTSWEMNQLHNEIAAWTPAVRDVEFKGIMKKFAPVTEGFPGLLDHMDYNRPAGMEALGILENMIIETKERRARGETVNEEEIVSTFAERVTKTIYPTKQLNFFRLDQEDDRRFRLNNEAVRAGSTLNMLRSNVTERELKLNQARRMIHLEENADSVLEKMRLNVIEKLEELKASSKAST